MPRPDGSSFNICGIGVASYTEPAIRQSAEYEETRTAILRSVTSVVDSFENAGAKNILGPGNVLVDANATQIKSTLVEAAQIDSPIVVYYCGHGIDHPGGFTLLTPEFSADRSTTSGLPLSDVRRVLSSTMENFGQELAPILLILDCCFSSAAAREIGASEFIRNSSQSSGRPLWVLATAGATEYARAGLAADALSAILQNPTSGASSPHLPLDSVLSQLQPLNSTEIQSVTLHAPPAFRTLPRFIPNTNYQSGATGAPLSEQHWIQKARGTSSNTHGWYLSLGQGRRNALSKLSFWSSATATEPDQNKLAVITGSPGAGKSTLLAVPVLYLVEASYRDSIAHVGVDAETLANLESILQDSNIRVIPIHARGLSGDVIAREIARVSIPGASIEGIEDLLIAFRYSQPQTRCLVIIDAVDEATSPRTLIESLVKPLSRMPLARVLIAGRRHVLPPSQEADAWIDLDDPKYTDSTALRQYISFLLMAKYEPNAHSCYRTQNPSHELIVDEIYNRSTAKDSFDSDREIQSFISARIIALALRGREAAIDVDSPDWRTAIPDGLIDAFREDLERLDSMQTLSISPMLEALAWARGPGLPWENLWGPVSSAIAGLDSTGGKDSHSDSPTYNSRHHLFDLIYAAGGYIIEDNHQGRSVFRLVHERIAEYFRDQRLTTHSLADVNMAIYRAITSLPELRRRRWDLTSPYVRSYLADHAAAASQGALRELVSDLGFLASADPPNLYRHLSTNNFPDSRVAIDAYFRAKQLFGQHVGHNLSYLIAELPDEGASGLAPLPDVRRPFEIRCHYRPRVAPDAIFSGARPLQLTRDFETPNILVTSDSLGVIRAWDLDTFLRIGEFEGPRVLPFALRLDRDENGALFVSAAHSQQRWLWSIDHSQLIRVGGNRPPPQSRDPLSEEQWWSFVDYSRGPDGRFYDIGYLNEAGRIEVRRVTGDENELCGWIPWQSPSEWVIGLGGADEFLVAIADSRRASVAVWDLKRRRRLSIRGDLRVEPRRAGWYHPLPANTFGFARTPDGHVVAVGLSQSSQLVTWIANTGEDVSLFDTTGTAIDDFEVAPIAGGGRSLLLIPDSSASTTYVYSAREIVRDKTEDQDTHVTAIAANSDTGRDLLALGHQDGTVQILDVAKMEVIHTIDTPALCVSLGIGVFESRVVVVCVSANHRSVFVSGISKESSVVTLDCDSDPNYIPGHIQKVILSPPNSGDGLISAIHSTGSVSTWISQGGWRKQWSARASMDFPDRLDAGHRAEVGLFVTEARTRRLLLVTAGGRDSQFLLVRDARTGDVTSRVSNQTILSQFKYRSVYPYSARPDWHAVSICHHYDASGRGAVSVSCLDGSVLTFWSDTWQIDLKRSSIRPVRVLDQIAMLVSNNGPPEASVRTVAATRDRTLVVNRWSSREPLEIQRRVVPKLMSITNRYLAVYDMFGLSVIRIRQ